MAQIFKAIPTKAMLRLQQQEQTNTTTSGTTLSTNIFKAIVFDAHKSKDNNTINSITYNLKNEARSRIALDNPEFDLKRAKRDVINFGISAFESKDKAAAKTTMAIKLGARPPKGPYINYKELLAEKRRQREDATEKSTMQQLGKNAQGNASVTYRALQKTRKRKLNGQQITRNYGVVKPKINTK